jgi:hypothetical protein
MWPAPPEANIGLLIFMIALILYTTKIIVEVKND